ncbi:hypothetical protein ACHAXS_003765 [Conticribra weissflogii]
MGELRYVENLQSPAGYTHLVIKRHPKSQTFSTEIKIIMFVTMLNKSLVFNTSNILSGKRVIQ